MVFCFAAQESATGGWPHSSTRPGGREGRREHFKCSQEKSKPLTHSHSSSQSFTTITVEKKKRMVLVVRTSRTTMQRKQDLGELAGGQMRLIMDWGHPTIHGGLAGWTRHISVVGEGPSWRRCTTPLDDRPSPAIQRPREDGERLLRDGITHLARDCSSVSSRGTPFRICVSEKSGGSSPR